MLRNISSVKLLIAAIVIPSLLLAGCSGNSANAQSGVGVVQEVTVTDSVESSGSVQALQMVTLTWGTSGIVASVNAKSGETISTGDVLLQLDASTAPSSIILAQADLTEAKQDLEDLKESNSAAAAAQLALANAQDAYNDALGSSYGATTVHGTEEQIQYYEAQLIIAKAKVDDLQFQYNRYGEAADGDEAKARALSNLMQAKIDQQNIEMYLNYYKSADDKIEASVVEANLAVAKAALEDAQRAYDRVKDGPTEDEIAAAQAKVDAYQSTVDSLKIIAPFSGEIAFIYNEVGDLVSGGTQAAIVVNRSKLYVDVLVDETSISSVKVGDSAVITFDAIDGLETTGKVTAVNPVGSSSSGVVNYTVRVTLDKSDAKILLGATANVVIQISDPTALMTVPAEAIQNDAQGEYVLRITNGTQERVNVVSGKIINEQVTVVGDLKAGDKVALISSSTTETDDSTTSTDQRGGFGLDMGGGSMPSGGGNPPSGGAQIP